MLPQGKRCVRSKMTLFLRLWVVRHRYEQLRPFGANPEESLEFHLEQLRECWTRVAACQKALGLEVQAFHPEDQFEAIYVVSGYVHRSLAEARSPHPELHTSWDAYLEIFGSLSHDANPYEFSDQSQRCFQRVCAMLDLLKGGFEAPAAGLPPIPFKCLTEAPF